MPPRVDVQVEEPAVAGHTVRFEARTDERDIVVHRIEFGDGVQQVTRFTCASDAVVAQGPAGPQTHVVDHTWRVPGTYDVTFHHGPPCREPTSCVTHRVDVTP